MLQAVLAQLQKVEYRNVERPVPGAKQVLIQIKRIGICGTDIHAYHGKHPYISCPIVQGHEFSGRIVEIGKDVTSLACGDDVTVMPQLTCGVCYPCTHGDYHICNDLKVLGCQAEGAAQEYLAVDEKLVVKLPEGMNYDYGAMIEPVAVGVHAVRRLGDVKGMKILILGAGPIGNLTAQVAKGLGAAAVMVTDLSEYRLGIAEKCGIDFCVNTSKEDLNRAIDALFGDNRADAILECVGSQATIEQAVKFSRKGSDVVIVGVFGQKPVVDIGLVQDKELRLIGTLMYKETDYCTAIDLIQKGRISLKPLISGYFHFKEFNEAYQHIEQNRDTSMKIIMNMEE